MHQKNNPLLFVIEVSVLAFLYGVSLVTPDIQEEARDMLTEAHEALLELCKEKLLEVHAEKLECEIGFYVVDTFVSEELASIV